MWYANATMVCLLITYDASLASGKSVTINSHRVLLLKMTAHILTGNLETVIPVWSDDVDDPEYQPQNDSADLAINWLLEEEPEIIGLILAGVDTILFIHTSGNTTDCSQRVTIADHKTT